MALTKGKTFAFLIIVVAAIWGIKYYYDTTPGEYDEVAKCLTAKGAIFYGSYQCSHCADQKKMFGKSMKYIKYIECGPLSGPMNQICKDAGVEAYPTWVIGDVKLTGKQEIDELKSQTQC